jgi:hypothetical protein
VNVPPGVMSAAGALVGAAVAWVMPPVGLFAPVVVFLAVGAVLERADDVDFEVVAVTPPVPARLVVVSPATVDSVVPSVVVVSSAAGDVSDVAPLVFFPPLPPHAAAMTPKDATTTSRRVA